MSKIRNSNPKRSAGGYERLLGHKELAWIFTRAHSTVIANGTELERIISELANTISDLDAFIDNCVNGATPNGSYLCNKKVLKKSRYKLDKHEPDFIIFTINNHDKQCYVVELKDGDTFDTKKSSAEKKMLSDFANHIGRMIQFITNPYICSFNQSDKDTVVTGFKNVFKDSEVLTGREFCDILGIDYDAIVKQRQDDVADNFEYVIDQLFEIDEVRSQFLKKFGPPTSN